MSASRGLRATGSRSARERRRNVITIPGRAPATGTAARRVRAPTPWSARTRSGATRTLRARRPVPHRGRDSRARGTRLAGARGVDTAQGRGPCGPRPSVSLFVGRSGAGSVNRLLELRLHLGQLVGVRLRVVTAEEQFSTLGQHGPNLGRGTATVTAVGKSQLGPGKGSWLHGGLPPFDPGTTPEAGYCDDRLRGTSTLPDVQHPCSCSRRVSRRPSRLPREQADSVGWIG